jgi:hypothetical protein
MVIDDLTITKNTTHTPNKCKIPNGNLIYDGLTIKSYGVRILYMNRDKIVLDAFSMPDDTPNKLRRKIQNHFDELIRILDLDNIPYDMDIFGDDNIEEDEVEYDEYLLRESNPKYAWLCLHICGNLIKEKETCCIDLEEYDELFKTECGHKFSVNNLYSWMNDYDNETCPLCRKQLM